MDLGVKLDRLTIGILPIKMKLMLIADSPRWMSIMMGIFSRFMSKKMQKRMVVVKGDAEAWATVASSVGGKQYCPPGFGEMGGTDSLILAAKNHPNNEEVQASTAGAIPPGRHLAPRLGAGPCRAQCRCCWLPSAMSVNARADISMASHM